ncbi:MAG: ATP phosphoribosyltransferase [Candidatus Dadabacteria bacterium]|nr:ATP phosphoribosyltransferase [Candidatus Dadabacteria bacterium]NIQ16307.1 ATP phosphoribosyltransferase [Candidatus Dadabacteria bacterium]
MSRGRLLEEAVVLFNKANLDISKVLKDSRKLIFEFKDLDLKILIVRPTDVPQYVEYGAADCGIVGKDTILEENFNLYEPLDLRIGKCKMIIAAPDSFNDNSSPTLRVATKYPKIASKFYSNKGISADIIKLYGSLELAPTVGLSDVIVDLTATGETLKKNNLKIIDTIADITARLVVNKVSMKVKSKSLKDIINRLKKAR